MLQQFLQMIENGSVQSHLDLAERMNISPAMVLQMAQELARKGYLEQFGQDCSSQSACSNCASQSGCQGLATRWTLTEKGRKAIKG